MWNSKEYQDDLVKLARWTGVPVSILRLPQVLRKRKIQSLISQGCLFDLAMIEDRIQLLYVKHFQKRKKRSSKDSNGACRSTRRRKGTGRASPS